MKESGTKHYVSMDTDLNKDFIPIRGFLTGDWSQDLKGGILVYLYDEKKLKLNPNFGVRGRHQENCKYLYDWNGVYLWPTDKS